VPGRYDMSRPENQRKLEAADDLARLADDSGLSLVHLGLAFVLNHPAVTSAIIGPRTREHLDSQLGASEVRLSEEILDRIDQIVPPGTNFGSADAGYESPSIGQAWRRRRRPSPT
jgi:aryl-alcohol dehydrogenase-like predicted oxidoreductase